MERFTWKIRITVLWIIMAVAISAHHVLDFMERDVVEQIWEMQMGEGMLIFMAFAWLVPLIMAALSMILKDSANRWANIVIGVSLMLFNIWHLVEHLTPLVIHQVLIVLLMVAVPALIAWSAWKWPKQEESD